MMHAMDWAAVASILSERIEAPLALLDKTGRIRAFNRAMEQKLGWPRFEVEGQPWSQICTAPDREPESKRWIAAARRGALRSYSVVALRKTGGSVMLQCDFSLVGHGTSQGLLMTVTHSRAIEDKDAKLSGGELDYEVSMVGANFGVLTRVCTDGEFVPVPQGSARCHQYLYGLAHACGDCPIRGEASAAPWPRTLVRRKSEPTAAGVAPVYQVTTAETTDGNMARIRVRNMPEATLAAIQNAKVAELAEQAKLSPREREVLSYMLLGRNLEEMATLVGITARTVKHHQANVLQKLGADSRADLIRLVF